LINVLLVVWRECFEAALIVGILSAVAKKQAAEKSTLVSKAVRTGVALGVILAIVLGAAIQFAESELQGTFLEHFQTALIALAAGLMVHMCFWMHTHGRLLKNEMEDSVAQATASVSARKTFYSVVGIAALAVAREGSEIVLFLYGMGIEAVTSNASHSSLPSSSLPSSFLSGMQLLVLSAAGGFILAIATYAALKRGLLFFSQRIFFRVTEIALFITALSMILSVARRLVSSGVISPISTQIWDTRFLLDESSAIGGFVAMLTGYESRPSLLVVLIGSAYCTLLAWFLKKQNGKFEKESKPFKPPLQSA
jgi:high-affinity iron transporter